MNEREEIEMEEKSPLWAEVECQVQHFGNSCGITSCAVAINALIGTHLNDVEIKEKFGYGVLAALNYYCANHYKWTDIGDLHNSSWPNLEHKTRNGFPFIIGLNGEFSITGNGHIVCVYKIEGENVYYTDSAEGPSGHMRVTTKAKIEACPPHPNGKFVFTCEKTSYSLSKDLKK